MSGNPSQSAFMNNTAQQLFPPRNLNLNLVSATPANAAAATVNLTSNGQRLPLPPQQQLVLLSNQRVNNVNLTGQCGFLNSQRMSKSQQMEHYQSMNNSVQSDFIEGVDDMMNYPEVLPQQQVRHIHQQQGSSPPLPQQSAGILDRRAPPMNKYNPEGGFIQECEDDDIDECFDEDQYTMNANSYIAFKQQQHDISHEYSMDPRFQGSVVRASVFERPHDRNNNNNNKSGQLAPVYRMVGNGSEIPIRRNDIFSRIQERNYQSDRGINDHRGIGGVYDRLLAQPHKQKQQKSTIEFTHRQQQFHPSTSQQQLLQQQQQQQVVRRIEQQRKAEFHSSFLEQNYSTQKVNQQSELKVHAKEMYQQQQQQQQQQLQVKHKDNKMKGQILNSSSSSSIQGLIQGVQTKKPIDNRTIEVTAQQHYLMQEDDEECSTDDDHQGIIESSKISCEKSSNCSLQKVFKDFQGITLGKNEHIREVLENRIRLNKDLRKGKQIENYLEESVQKQVIPKYPLEKLQRIHKRQQNYKSSALVNLVNSVRHYEEDGYEFEEKTEILKYIQNSIQGNGKKRSPPPLPKEAHQLKKKLKIDENEENIVTVEKPEKEQKDSASQSKQNEGDGKGSSHKKVKKAKMKKKQFTSDHEVFEGDEEEQEGDVEDEIEEDNISKRVRLNRQNAKGYKGKKVCDCGRDRSGDLRLCDNRKCKRQWFHLDCLKDRLGSRLPEDEITWFCSECNLHKNLIQCRVLQRRIALQNQKNNQTSTPTVEGGNGIIENKKQCDSAVSKGSKAGGKKSGKSSASLSNHSSTFLPSENSNSNSTSSLIPPGGIKGANETLNSLILNSINNQNRINEQVQPLINSDFQQCSSNTSVASNSREKRQSQQQQLETVNEKKSKEPTPQKGETDLKLQTLLEQYLIPNEKKIPLSPQQNQTNSTQQQQQQQQHVIICEDFDEEFEEENPIISVVNKQEEKQDIESNLNDVNSGSKTSASMKEQDEVILFEQQLSEKGNSNRFPIKREKRSTESKSRSEEKKVCQKNNLPIQQELLVDQEGGGGLCVPNDEIEQEESFVTDLLSSNEDGSPRIFHCSIKEGFMTKIAKKKVEVSAGSDIVVLLQNRPIFVQMFVYGGKSKSLTLFYTEKVKGNQGDSKNNEYFSASHVQWRGNSYVVLAQASGYSLISVYEPQIIRVNGNSSWTHPFYLDSNENAISLYTLPNRGSSLSHMTLIPFERTVQVSYEKFELDSKCAGFSQLGFYRKAERGSPTNFVFLTKDRQSILMYPDLAVNSDKPIINIESPMRLLNFQLSSIAKESFILLDEKNSIFEFDTFGDCNNIKNPCVYKETAICQKYYTQLNSGYLTQVYPEQICLASLDSLKPPIVLSFGKMFVDAISIQVKNGMLIVYLEQLSNAQKTFALQEFLIENI